MEATEQDTQTPETTPEPEAKPNPNADLIKGLRAVCDYLEAHPTCGKIWAFGRLLIVCSDKKDLLERIKGAGEAKKNVEGQWFNVDKQFSEDVTLQWYVRRDQICERVIDQKVVPAEPEKVIPETVIPAKPERIVEEVSWVCPESLLRGDEKPEPVMAE